MELLDLVKEALDKVKAKDVICYDLRGFSPLADFTVIATVDVVRQAQGVISYIEEHAKESNLRLRGVEGRDSTWMLIDFYDVILHVFTKEERDNYNLDKLYVNIPKKNWN